MPFDGPYSGLMDKYGFIPANHAAPQLIGLDRRFLFDENGNTIDGYFRLVETGEGATLEIKNDEYRWIPDAEIFGQLEEAISKSTLDATDMQVATDYAAGGRRLFRQYVFPAHQVEVAPGVPVALRMIFFNSIDGTTAFSGRAGAYSFVCANTSIVGKDIGNFRMKHTGEGLDVEAVLKGLVEASSRHALTLERMKAWPQIEVVDTTARQVINAMQISDAQRDRLVHSWVVAKDEEAPITGANLLTLHAVMTAWATHGDEALGAMAGNEAKRGAVSMDQRKKRESIVANVMDTGGWQHLEAAV